MKLTQNSFRLKCGLVMAVAGIAMLALADWHTLNARYQWRGRGMDAWLHDRYRAKWDPTAAPVGIGMVALMFAGVLLLEFKGDPPPRKDPWEE